MNRDKIQGALFAVLLAIGIGALFAQGGPVRPASAHPPIATLTMTPHTFTATASNGVTPVTLVAAASGKAIVPVDVTLRNADSVWHTITLQSDTTTILPLELGPGGEFFLDNIDGWIRTSPGGALKFAIDGGGTGNLVTASGVGLQ